MWRREASTSGLPTFMLGPETVTQLMGRLAPRTTDPTTQHPHMRRVMCPRDRYIYIAPAFYEGEGYGSVYSTRPAYIDQSYMHAEELPPRPPAPVPTTTRRVVASINPMVGWDTVTDICRDKGRFSGEPSFVFLGTMRIQQSATAVCAAIRKSDVMTQASQWPRRRHAHSRTSPSGHSRHFCPVPEMSAVPLIAAE